MKQNKTKNQNHKKTQKTHRRGRAAKMLLKQTNKPKTRRSKDWVRGRAQAHVHHPSLFMWCQQILESVLPNLILLHSSQYDHCINFLMRISTCIFILLKESSSLFPQALLSFSLLNVTNIKFSFDCFLFSSLLKSTLNPA